MSVAATFTTSTVGNVGPTRTTGTSTSTSSATGVPNVCYDQCSAAFIEAESEGKTPSICAVDGAFNSALADCRACIESHGSLDGFQDHVVPDFQQFLEFCAADQPASASLALSTLLSQALALGFSIVPVQTTSTGAIAISSGANLTSTTSTTSTTNITGINNSIEPSTVIASPISTSPKPANHAWISGVVVGPAFLIGLILAVFLLIRRRRSKRSTTNNVKEEPSIVYEKVELHADDIKPRELEALERQELPAMEVVSHELSADPE